MRRVALFSTNFLEYSQTFVHQEVTHHERYAVEVFTRKRLLADRFPFEPVHESNMFYAATRYSRLFHRLFRERTYDLIHAHFGTGAVYAVPYVRRYRRPFVVTFHGYDVPLMRSAERLLPKYWPYTATCDDMLRRLTLGLCASRELLELLVDIGVPRAKLRLYHLGIDLEQFRPGTRTELPRVMMVGRFVEKKGFEYGIRAFAAARRSGAPGELLIVGGGEREQALRALVEEHDVADAVRFAGVLTSEQIAALLAESDVIMAPSVVGIDGNRESGVIALKEGSASGCAALGTYHGGIPEIIDDGSTGFLVPERDVDALAARLHLLLTNRERTAELGRAARAKMEREYDLATQVRKLEQHYDEAVALHAAHR